MRDIDRSGDRQPRACRFSAYGGEREAVIDVHNKRIKLYGLMPAEMEGLEPAELAPGTDRSVFSKVIVYTVEGNDEEWRLLGFRKEGIISGFFPGHVDGHIWASFTDELRGRDPHLREHDGIVEAALRKKKVIPRMPQDYRCETAGEDDIDGIASLLQQSFEDYPVPLDHASVGRRLGCPEHLFRIMRDDDGEIAAVASAEIDLKRESAELTDCASRAGERGRGLMTYLLWRLEQDLVADLGISDLYSLVRSGEIDMNMVFGKLGYQYSGRLLNNCRMPRGFESVNIWCKTARKGITGDRVDKLSFA